MIAMAMERVCRKEMNQFVNAIEDFMELTVSSNVTGTAREKEPVFKVLAFAIQGSLEGSANKISHVLKTAMVEDFASWENASAKTVLKEIHAKTLANVRITVQEEENANTEPVLAMLVSKDSDANSRRNVLGIALKTASVILESVSAILVGKA